MAAFVSRSGDQAHGQIAHIRANDLDLRTTASNDQRQHVAAIHVFQFPFGIDSGDEHGGVFFADSFLGKEAI